MVVCHESGTFVRGWSSIYVKTFIMSASTQGSFMSSLVNSSLSENLALASCFFLQLTAWLENPPNHSKQGFPKSTCSWDRTLVHPLLSKGQGAYGQTSEYIPSIKVHAHPAETSTYFHFTWMMIYTLRSRRPVSFRCFDPFHFLPSRPHAWAIMKMMHGKKIFAHVHVQNIHAWTFLPTQLLGTTRVLWNCVFSLITAAGIEPRSSPLTPFQFDLACWRFGVGWS